MVDILLRCGCGRVRGYAHGVSRSAGFRFVCYCKDCQAFARFLERTDILDVAGGTDIFQMPPGRVMFTAGFEALSCLRLSGKALRWYADCCRTPIANTAADPRFPSRSFIRSWFARRANSRAMRCSAHRCAAFMSTLPSGRFRQTPRRRCHFAFLPTVQQRWWAGALMRCAYKLNLAHQLRQLGDVDTSFTTIQFVDGPGRREAAGHGRHLACVVIDESRLLGRAWLALAGSLAANSSLTLSACAQSSLDPARTLSIIAAKNSALVFIATGTCTFVHRHA